MPGPFPDGAVRQARSQRPVRGLALTERRSVVEGRPDQRMPEIQLRPRRLEQTGTQRFLPGGRIDTPPGARPLHEVPVAAFLGCRQQQQRARCGLQCVGSRAERAPQPGSDRDRTGQDLFLVQGG